MEPKIIEFPKKNLPKGTSKPHTDNPKKNVISFNMYKLRKSLRKQGFEIVEDANGKITLVVRVTN